jgi:hypothetical protein
MQKIKEAGSDNLISADSEQEELEKQAGLKDNVRIQMNITSRRSVE